MRFIIMALSGLFVAAPTYAQTDLPLLKSDPSREASLIKAIDQKYQQDVSSIQGKFKKQVEEIYTERLKGVKDLFLEKEITTDPEATQYLNKILQEILKANPSLDGKEIRLLFSRAWWPNASSMGEGTLVFNIGLFHRLSNEAQAAFVICHELAHYYLNHSNYTITRYVQTMNSDEFQDKLKKIKKADYAQNKMVEDLMKGVVFKTRRHSREFESAADSMALALFQNTGWAPSEALSCLALLDTVDKAKFPKMVQVSESLNFSSYPFKSHWIKGNSISFAIVNENDKGESDSLKTHPDCKIRAERLRHRIESLSKKGNKKFLVSESDFIKLSARFDREILNYTYESNNLSLCLYYALRMRVNGDTSLYTLMLAGKCLNDMYRYQKAHQLGKYVTVPNPAFETDYNELLKLIQNTRLSELAAINYYFLEPESSKLITTSEGSKVWNQCKQNFGK